MNYAKQQDHLIPNDLTMLFEIFTTKVFGFLWPLFATEQEIKAFAILTEKKE